MNRTDVPLRSLRLALTTLLALALVMVGPVAAVSADTTAGPTVTLTAPADGKAGVAAPFVAAVRDGAGAPVTPAAVVLQRRVSTTPETWTTVVRGTTASDGNATLRAARAVGASSWRAQYVDSAGAVLATSPTVSSRGLQYASTLALTGPRRVVDEKSIDLALSWAASDGSPVAGAVTVYRKLGSGAWASYAKVKTSSAGRATLRVTPRVDSTWRATGAAGAWWLADSTPNLGVDNVPSGDPVAYPAAAPRPASTPAQGRASGAGANPVITAIPNAVWRSMVGRSWHRGCPVGRSSLRLLRVNYWGFDGYRYRGEMVLSSAAVARAGAAFKDMYNGRFPIRRMYRVDRFGWSRKLHGANDYASMRADNTSGFNCRSVVNKPRVLSPHARGRAIDVNTWENPYRSATGLVPNSWWASRSHPRIAWRSSSHPVVRIWRAHGFRWTYGTGDSQHVDGRTTLVLGGFSG